jgi:superfamily II DNA or RNA helicase
MGAVEELSSLDRLLASFDHEGRAFEVLCRWFLQNEPEFMAEYEQVWLWAEWPGRWGPDRGIDLIARTFDGRTHAVQAKNYGLTHAVTKRDIDTFLSESNRAGIDSRLLIASTDKVARSAREVMADQEKPVSTCLLSRMRASAVQWPANIAELAPAVPAAAQPREYQLMALDAIDRWAKGGVSRGQVIMACGTGKSLIEIWAAERLQAQNVLLLVPTIALLRQCARAWPQHAATQRRLLRICSDKAPDALGAEDITRDDELSTARTTDPEEIAGRLRGDSPLLVLCTYDSSPVLGEAMQSVADFSFDLAIADEAHRCAGLESSKRKTILNETAIRAKRRLFFTATPTVYGTRDKGRAANKNVRLASMDDHTIFGRVIHHLSFSNAIALGLLCPYQVAVIAIDDEEVHDLIKRRRVVTADGEHNLEAACLATQIACARAMRRHDCRRIVAFHPTIPESKSFSEHFPTAVEMLSGDDHLQGTVWSRHVDGRYMSHATRTRLIEQFESGEGDEYRLLSNVRLLTEGVNVPDIDGIAFVDTHRGQVSIIQAVGRAVRPAPEKTVGTIILPVVLRKGESFDAALARSEHRSIVDILGALLSHDPDIVKSLDELRYSHGTDHLRPGTHGRFVIDAPVQVGDGFAEAVDIALAGALGTPREHSALRRSPPIERLLITEGKPPSDDELFASCMQRLTSQGRWLQLLPEVPPQDASSYPMQAWWTEVKKRWVSGTLDLDDRTAIAESVSWLAMDLQYVPHAVQRREMARLTNADVPEQIASQCRGGGIYARSLEALTGWQYTDELVSSLRAIHRLVTHAALSPATQARYVLPAARRLSEAVQAAGDASGLGDWEQRSWRSAAINGFLYELELAYAGPPGEQPDIPWTATTTPVAHLIGRRSAEPFAQFASRMSMYGFRGDKEAVEARIEDEVHMTSNERLDALGWEIYLLARVRGDTSEDAFALAMDGTFHGREKVRRDFLVRSLRDIAS